MRRRHGQDGVLALDQPLRIQKVVASVSVACLEKLIRQLGVSTANDERRGSLVGKEIEEKVFDVSIVEKPVEQLTLLVDHFVTLFPITRVPIRHCSHIANLAAILVHLVTR